MSISQFDYYIDKAINGDYLSQTKRISSIPEKIEENIIYYSPTFEKEVIDQNWEKLLYYFYVSCGSLLDLCILIETRCKFYDPKTTVYQKICGNGIYRANRNSNIFHGKNSNPVWRKNHR